jgi:hypothetical protein
METSFYEVEGGGMSRLKELLGFSPSLLPMLVVAVLAAVSALRRRDPALATIAVGLALLLGGALYALRGIEQARAALVKRQSADSVLLELQRRAHTNETVAFLGWGVFIAGWGWFALKKPKPKPEKETEVERALRRSYEHQKAEILQDGCGRGPDSGGKE